MLKKLIALTLVGAFFVGTQVACAVEILLDAPVEVPAGSKMGDVELSILAFRDATDCKTWYWVPSHFSDVKGVGHIPNILTSAYEYKIDGKNDTSITLESSYRLTIAGRGLNKVSEKDLRGKIANIIRERSANESSINPIAPRYLGCGNVDASSINLVHLFNQSRNIKIKANDNEFSKKGVFAEAYIPGEYNSSSLTITNLENPFSMQLDYDATNPIIEPDFSKRLEGNTPISIAKFQIETTGIKTNSQASLRVHGSISAKWKTDLVKNTNCTSDGSSAGLGSGFFGIALGILGFNSSSHSCTTTESFKTQLVGCKDGDTQCKEAVKSDLSFDYHLLTDAAMERVNVLECADSSCSQAVPVPYEAWLKATLLSMWMESNFSATKDDLGKVVLNPTGLADGTITASMDSMVRVQTDKKVPVTISTDVFISGLTADDTLSKYLVKDDLLKCAWKNYRKARRFFKINGTDQTVPVHPSCFEGDWQ